MSQEVEKLSPADTRLEADLLLSCARTHIDLATARHIRELACSSPDWDHLMQIATRHRLKPLLYRSLTATCPDAVPPKILDELRRYFLANALTNSVLSEELVRLLSLFEAQGIAAVPYKGPALAASVYGDLSLRKSGDLDILIHRHDLTKAKEVLISEGYQPQLTGDQEASALQKHYHLTFAREDGMVFVEIHWAFTFSYWQFPLDLKSLETRLESVTLARRKVPNIPQEELLLILCIHGAKHFWWHLVWLCDVSEFLRQERGISWEKLIAQADAVRFRRILFLGLFLAKDLFGAPVPKEVWRSIQADPVVSSLAAQVREHLFPSPNGVTKDYNDFDERTFYRRSRESLRDRMRYFRYDYLGGSTVLMPNATDRELVQLPTSLDFLYRVFRPLRLAFVHGPRVLLSLVKYLIVR